MNHCCTLMTSEVNDPRVQIGYEQTFREYYIPLIYQGKTTAVDTLSYCPWCGTKLPDSLRDELFTILEKEYEINDDLDERVPEEFKTDEWWKKRNL